MSGVVRLGAVSYLNVEPLLAGLDTDTRFELVREIPSRIADALHGGTIDLGTIPSIEYANGDYAIVKGIGIASRGAVRSVCLYHRRPVTSIRSVALDVSSRTSVALLRVLLAAKGVTAYHTVTVAPDVDAMLQRADAALVIGDTALAYRGDAEVLDFGIAWKELTGLPFVYAFWAGRPGAVTGGQLAGLGGAAARGLVEIPAIAARYNGMAGLEAKVKEAYLRDNIRFRLGDEEYAGLLEFYGRARAVGVIRQVPPLRFYGEL